MEERAGPIGGVEDRAVQLRMVGMVGLIGIGSRRGAEPGAAPGIWQRLASRLDRRATAPVLGMEISANAVRLVEVQGSADAPELVRFGVEPLPDTAVRNNAIAAPEEVAAAIRTLVQRTGTRVRRVVTAVPGPAVIVRKVHLQLAPGDDLETLVMIEAGSLIPENFENISLDYHVLRAENEEIEAIVVAVRRDILSGYTNAILDAGLDPVIVDVETFALENAYELNHEPALDDIVALVNVGARYSSVSIVRGGLSTATGDVPAGDGLVVDALSRAGLEPADVRRAQRGEAVPGVPEETLRSIIDDAVAQIADTIAEFLDFLSRTSVEGVPRSIVLSGGGAREHGLLEAVAQRSGLPAEFFKTFERVKIGRKVDPVALESAGPSLAVAMGLGTRRPGDS